MAWQEAVDLSKFIVSAAPFGGPIGKWNNSNSHAIEHDSCRKWVHRGKDVPTKKKHFIVQIFTNKNVFKLHKCEGQLRLNLTFHLCIKKWYDIIQ